MLIHVTMNGISASRIVRPQIAMLTKNTKM